MCPVEVEIASAPSDKATHTVSNQEQETRATEGCRQPAGEGGHRARPGLLQQAVSCSQESWRSSPVIDLSTLNRHLVVPHFQMEMAQTVRAAIRQNEWTVSIDIKDLHMLMSQSVRKCLRFCVNMKTYQFMCLSFGQAISPREFTKLLHPVVQLLRLQGVHLHVYLDN